MIPHHACRHYKKKNFDNFAQEEFSSLSKLTDSLLLLKARFSSLMQDVDAQVQSISKHKAVIIDTTPYDIMSTHLTGAKKQIEEGKNKQTITIKSLKTIIEKMDLVCSFMTKDKNRIEQLTQINQSTQSLTVAPLLSQITSQIEILNKEYQAIQQWNASMLAHKPVFCWGNKEMKISNEESEKKWKLYFSDLPIMLEPPYKVNVKVTGVNKEDKNPWKIIIGLCSDGAMINGGSTWIGANEYGWGYAANGLATYGKTSKKYGSAYGSGDVISIIVNKERALGFERNGVYQGLAYEGVIKAGSEKDETGSEDLYLAAALTYPGHEVEIISIEELKK